MKKREYKFASMEGNKMKKYYGILQSKVKNLKGDWITKEFIYDVEGLSPIHARNEAEAEAKEKGLSLVKFMAYQD